MELASVRAADPASGGGTPGAPAFVFFPARPGSLLALALGLALVAPIAAPAQDYPARAVKIIVPFPAGGTADVMPRIFADWLARKWGHPVVVENRTGA